MPCSAEFIASSNNSEESVEVELQEGCFPRCALGCQVLDEG